MGVKDFLQRLKENRNKKKELLNQALEQDRVQKLVEERKKSSNERELEKFMEEERQEKIKGALKDFREKRKKDIALNHNPLNIPNITRKTQWEVLKEPNLFTGRSTIDKQKNLFFKY